MVMLFTNKELSVKALVIPACLLFVGPATSNVRNLIEYNTCSFNKLAIDMPEIYSKILDSLSYCNETTYAVLMSEANNDAVAIRDYLEKKGEKFHSIDFLHSMYATISDCIERKHPENNNLNFKLNTVKL